MKKDDDRERRRRDTIEAARRCSGLFPPPPWPPIKSPANPSTYERWLREATQWPER